MQPSSDQYSLKEIVKRLCAPIVTGVIVGAAFFALAAPSQRPCQYPRGSHLELWSAFSEPFVVVWGSRQELLDYLAGKGDDFTADYHTHSNPEGTGVIVVSNCPQPNNVVKVLVTTGPHKGFGWVDIHNLRVPDPSS